MEAELIRKDLFTDIVEILVDTHDSNGDPRSQSDIDAETEKKRNARKASKMAEARAELILNVEPGQLPHMRSRDPLDIWQDLKMVHRARGFAASLAMRRQFLTMKKMKAQKMSAWIGEIRAQAFEMEEAGLQVSDNDTILALTMGLPPSFDNLIMSFDDTPSADLTLDYVVTRLLNEETRQKSRNNLRTQTETTADDTGVALTVKPVTPVDQITCFFCDAKGHYKSDCPERKFWMEKKGMAMMAIDDEELEDF